MKKLTFLFLLLLVFVTLLPAALAGDEVPDSIMEKLLPYTTDEGYWLQSFETMPTGEWAAATLQRQDGRNLLMLFRNKRGEWTTYAVTDSAVFQGRKQVSAFFSQDAVTFETSPSHTDFIVRTPTLWVCQANADNDEEAEYNERSLVFTLRDGQWLLTAWEDFDHCAAFITEDALYYYGSWLAEYEPWYGRVDGTIQRDIRWTGVNLIPNSYEKALKTVTAAPNLPTGDLSAQEVRFTGGKKYAVYSAPDKQSLRAGNGKAAVSTNGWIQVFGMEEDWALIQYSIDSAHYRFGYIPAKALPKDAAIKPLAFDPAAAYLTADAPVTDDPLYSRAALVTLPDGAPVSLLAVLGDWAYIESSSGDLLRGFVPQSALSSARVYDLENWPNHAGQPVLRGQLVVDRRAFSATISPNLSGVSIPAAGFLVYDNISGALLPTTSQRSADGMLVIRGSLPAETTSLRIVPLFSEGSSGEPAHAVVVEW